MNQGQFIRKLEEHLEDSEFGPLDGEIVASNNRNLWEEYEITFVYLLRVSGTSRELFVQFHPNAPAIPLRTALVYSVP